MIVRSRRAVALVAAALLLVQPVGAQEPPSQVWFDGFGFAFTADLGRSVNITDVTADPPGAGGPFEPAPPSTTFSLYGSLPSSGNGRVPRVGATPVTVYEFDVAEAPPDAAEKIGWLTQLLDDRPDLASQDTLPFLPPVEAGQALIARAEYVDTPHVSGIAHVAYFTQDTFPITSDDLVYLFQGLSADGSRYVSVFAQLTTELFPETPSRRLINRVSTGEGWPPYIAQATQTIAEASPDDFTPSLASLEALVASITFGPAPGSADGDGG